MSDIKSLDDLLEYVGKFEDKVFTLSDYHGSQSYGLQEFPNNKELLVGLRNAVELLGSGSYKVTLKSSKDARDGYSKVLRFHNKPEGGQPLAGVPQPQMDLAGIQSTIDNKVADALGKASKEFETKLKHMEEVRELKDKIKELKDKDKPNQVVKAIESSTPVLAGLLVAIFPESEKAINNFMNMQYEDVEEEDLNEPIKPE